jgi:GntR family transcriptional regulator
MALKNSQESIIKNSRVSEVKGKYFDETEHVPLYYQLKKLISEEIDKGNYDYDSPIPTEMELINTYRISRTTVRQAILELVQEGKLYRVKGKGTFVAKPKISQNFMNTRMHSFIAPTNEEVINSGRVPSTEVVSLTVVPMPDAMVKLCGAEQGAMTICLYRKRCADGVPILRVKTYLPVKRCSFVLEHNFVNEGLYDVLSTQEDTKILKVSKTCEAVAAGREDVEILGVKRGSPIHFFTTIGYNTSGEVIEYSLSHFRGDRHRFHVEISLSSGN